MMDEKRKIHQNENSWKWEFVQLRIRKKENSWKWNKIVKKKIRRKKNFQKKISFGRNFFFVKI